MQNKIAVNINIKPKILLVESNKQNEKSIDNALSSLDCEIIKANTGIDALNKVLQYDFALILLELQMPVISGLEIANLIKENDKTKNIPIVFVTDFSKEDQGMLDSNNLGAIDYIVKPIDSVILYSKVAVYLNHYKQVKDLENEIKLLNVTQDKLLKTNYKLKELSKSDPLTGMLNRMCFDDLLTDVVNSYAKKNKISALMLMDLDNFKQINDHYGHDVGDKILQIAGNRMKSVIADIGKDVSNSMAHISRLGGDEFAVIISNLHDFNIIFSINNAIKSAFEDPFIINNIEFKIGASVGVAVCPYDGTTPNMLYKNADQAMYRSKNTGKNKISFFSEINLEQVKSFTGIDLDIKAAISNKEFYLNYQPIYDLKTKKIVGCEALCRWNHPQYGIIPPCDFVFKAEQSGLINDLGAWVLEEAIAKTAMLHSYGSKLTCSVNVSVMQLYNPKFSSFLKEKLKKYNLPSCYIELEITETTIASKSSNYDNNILEIDEMCVKISIDDFGTGHSSLKRLSELPISTLKIDRSFMKEIHNKDNMILTVLELARNLNLKVIAEGIETEEQLNYLVNNGCQYGQGFLMSKPVDFKNFMNLIKSDKIA